MPRKPTKTETQLRRYKPLRKNATMVKAVFDEAKKQISEGKHPNITQIHRDVGYTEWCALTHKACRTVTWKRLMDFIPDDRIAWELLQLATDPEDKRTKLEAIKEINRLKDHYPASKLKINTFQEGINQFYDTEDQSEILESGETTEDA